MQRHGKAPAVDDATDIESNRRHGHRRGGRRVYVEGNNGATTVRYTGPDSSVEFVTVVQGLSVPSADTKYPLCSDMVNRAKLSPDTAISPGKWAIPWQPETPTPPFSDRFTHHQAPGPVGDDRRVAELVGRWDFVDTNFAEPGESKPVTRLPTRRYMRIRDEEFAKNEDRQKAGLDDECGSESGWK